MSEEEEKGEKKGGKPTKSRVFDCVAACATPCGRILGAVCVYSILTWLYQFLPHISDHPARGIGGQLVLCPGMPFLRRNALSMDTGKSPNHRLSPVTRSTRTTGSTVEMASTATFEPPSRTTTRRRGVRGMMGPAQRSQTSK